MVSTRRARAANSESPAVVRVVDRRGAHPLAVSDGGASPLTDSGGGNQAEAGGYEKCRDERIKENKERMMKLGILNLSQDIQSLASAATARSQRISYPSSFKRTAADEPTRPSRRSSRLQNKAPISYSAAVTEEEKPVRQGSKRLKNENEREELYTDEHEKLLGSCISPWTLFVDGYGKDGKRIYDSIKGKTCHQCRQKTLGCRTHCSKCNMVQGQFCGDCLFMRYGENVLEAKANSHWICPVCRGICNCSLCRIHKGWAPTGLLYKRATNLGFKSVAHYLIQTRRADRKSPEADGVMVSLER